MQGRCFVWEGSSRDSKSLLFLQESLQFCSSGNDFRRILGKDRSWVTAGDEGFQLWVSVGCLDFTGLSTGRNQVWLCVLLNYNSVATDLFFFLPKVENME